MVEQNTVCDFHLAQDKRPAVFLVSEYVGTAWVNHLLVIDSPTWN